MDQTAKRILLRDQVSMLVATTFVLLLVATKVRSGCDSDPDGTNEHLSITLCNPSDPIHFNSIIISKDDGSNDYPIDVRHPVTVFGNFTNTASTSFDNVVVSASIARYTDIFGFCSWIGIPTFGLLDHIDGCNFGATHMCPIPVGVTVIRDRIDPTPYEPIISILSASEPYRLQLSFKTGSTEIACLQIEGRIMK